MNGFFDNFYGTFFDPDKTFENLKNNPALFQGFLIVLFISSIGPLLSFDYFHGFMSVIVLGLFMFFAVFGGIFSWILLAVFLDAVARIFKQSGKIRVFLTLSSFSLLPWLLLAPVQLLKTAGTVGQLFGIVLGLLIWVWVGLLFILSVIKAYELSITRALILVALPFFASILSFYWFISFFSTIINILNT